MQGEMLYSTCNQRVGQVPLFDSKHRFAVFLHLDAFLFHLLSNGAQQTLKTSQGMFWWLFIKNRRSVQHF